VDGSGASVQMEFPGRISRVVIDDQSVVVSWT
jgi:hypothetical protein